MASTGSARVRIGDMLLAAGLIDEPGLEEALVAQKRSGLRLGKQLVELGHVSEVQVTQTLSNQLSVPWVSIARIEFSASLLRRVPAELAEKYCVMPIYVRSVREQGDTLYVAMDDPTDVEALEAVARAASLPVRPMVAPPSDIRSAIERRYFGSAESIAPASMDLGGSMGGPAAGSDPRASAAPPAGKSLPQPPPAVPSAGPPASVSSSLIPMERFARPSEAPVAPKSAKTLTFLDGTTLALPNAAKASEGASEAREVSDLMKAILDAQKRGASDDPPRWTEVIQVLLDLARDRGLVITRKDFTEAWLRSRG